MTKQHERLTEGFLKNLDRPGRFSDGGRGSNGLYVLAQPRKHQSDELAIRFCQRVRVNGKPTNIGLGPFPAIRLRTARARAAKNFALAYEGKDPRFPDQPVQGNTPNQIFDIAPPLGEVLASYILLHSPEWSKRTIEQWQSIPTRHFSGLLAMPVSAIRPKDVIECLESAPAGQRERVRQMLSDLFLVAVAREWRKDDPANKGLRKLMPKRKPVKHHDALHHSKVSEALKKIDGSDSRINEREALKFVVLTGLRVGEVLGMTWDEVKTDVVTIPASRMKAKRDHRVPLSPQAQAIISEARKRTESDLVFPSIRGKVILRARISELLKKAKVECTTHGFRSSLRSWCADRGVAREVAEMCLAHAVGSQTEQSYQRSDLLDQRREVMAEWGAYVWK